jgi:hypothetical protein
MLENWLIWHTVCMASKSQPGSSITVSIILDLGCNFAPRPYKTVRLFKLVNISNVSEKVNPSKEGIDYYD